MSNSNISDKLVHALISGTIAYVESKAWNLNGQVRLPGLGITDVSTALAASTAASAVASDYLEQYVQPLLPTSDSFVKAENFLLGPGLSGLASLAVLSFSDAAELDKIGKGKAFLVTALADI